MWGIATSGRSPHLSLTIRARQLVRGRELRVYVRSSTPFGVSLLRVSLPFAFPADRSYRLLGPCFVGLRQTGKGGSEASNYNCPSLGEFHR